MSSRERVHGLRRGAPAARARAGNPAERAVAAGRGARSPRGRPAAARSARRRRRWAPRRSGPGPTPSSAPGAGAPAGRGDDEPRRAPRPRAHPRGPRVARAPTRSRRRASIASSISSSVPCRWVTTGVRGATRAAASSIGVRWCRCRTSAPAASWRAQGVAPRAAPGARTRRRRARRTRGRARRAGPRRTGASAAMPGPGSIGSCAASAAREVDDGQVRLPGVERVGVLLGPGVAARAGDERRRPPSPRAAAALSARVACDDPPRGEKRMALTTRRGPAMGLLSVDARPGGARARRSGCVEGDHRGDRASPGELDAVLLAGPVAQLTVTDEASRAAAVEVHARRARRGPPARPRARRA